MSRILIAEDEGRIASFIQKGLRANGFAPTIASDGDEAMAHAVSGQFDLVILDLGLPGKDGLEVLDELLARVRARLRGDRTREETMLRVGAAILDLRTRRARVGERTVELTAREFAMAEMLFRHPGQVLSREQLLSHVWGYDYDPGSNVVDVYVRYLRKKLGRKRITSARGMGYRLES